MGSSTRACGTPPEWPSRRFRRRPRVAEGGQKVRFFLLRGGEMTRLHVPEAANLLGNRRDRDGGRVVLARELRGELLHRFLVVGDELALEPALVGMAEHVERRAAQELEPRERAKGLHHPRPELALFG